MSQASLPLEQLCDIAMQAARAAGELIQSADRKKLQREFKQAGSSEASQIVTELDLRSEALIRERLLTVSEQWNIAFVGEESSQTIAGLASDRLSKPYFWCVDPLDGTLPFMEGGSGYAVSIALVEQSGNPLIGVVYDPVSSTLTHAIKGQGAYRDEAPFTVETSEPSSLTVFADQSFKQHENYRKALETLSSCAHSLKLDDATLVYGNGAVKNACQVLEQSAACYVKLPKAKDGGGSIWDFAASACIAIEAGGWVSNIYGNPLELNRPGSTFMNHQGVIYASSEQIARCLSEDFFKLLHV